MVSLRNIRNLFLNCCSLFDYLSMGANWADWEPCWMVPSTLDISYATCCKKRRIGALLRSRGHGGSETSAENRDIGEKFHDEY